MLASHKCVQYGPLPKIVIIIAYVGANEKRGGRRLEDLAGMRNLCVAGPYK